MTFCYLFGLRSLIHYFRCIFLSLLSTWSCFSTAKSWQTYPRREEGNPTLCLAWLSYLVLSYLTLLPYLTLSYLILSDLILSHLRLSDLISCYLILSYLILSICICIYRGAAIRCRPQLRSRWDNASDSCCVAFEDPWSGAYSSCHPCFVILTKLRPYFFSSILHIFCIS